MVEQGSSATLAAPAVVPSLSTGGPSGAQAPEPPSASESSAAASEASASSPMPPSQSYSLDVVEAMLSLVSLMMTSTPGCTALADAGVVSALLPLLRDYDPLHLNIISTAIKVLELFMDYSQVWMDMK
jgi:hypothetical protein